jgi:micrococcal nuclease
MNKVLLILLLVSCHQVKDVQWFDVRRVTDGDTLVIDDGSQKGIRLRLIGIDAPESRDYKHRKAEAFGLEATAFMEQLVDGQQVRLEFDVEKQDKYGRYLAYVYTRSGTFLNNEMVLQGYAQTMTIQPNSRYEALFYDSQQQAKRAQKGIWTKL